ncbi:LOG family protein [Aporhodopirellula aestuarii]|uniref:AMP nucleosidase n=1 Tax=Aporhodopirellula aestuarii TaxID=2950107 RepID=A0ABT0U0K5_9BACT|nr:TIGR00730 family Rossman fold protein [Aporhodopirellula aestuarii]MCM2370028.1 TIGR00730 family Rossman fold protein [Aporhodopirellula aestuarii]
MNRSEPPPPSDQDGSTKKPLEATSEPAAEPPAEPTPPPAREPRPRGRRRPRKNNPGEEIQRLPSEAIGEDELHRPQPADEPISRVNSQDLFQVMRHTIERLERDETARGDIKILSRTLRELRYAFQVFRPYRRRRKVTIFGSARTAPDQPDYQSAVDLGRRMAAHGWMVITGAGGGIMEAGHKGAGRDASMGLNIMLPFEQGANEYIDNDPKLVTMKYFFTRKLMFVKECSGVVCLPGGFGTLDEACETLTLLQTGKQTMIPLVLLDHPEGSYWKDLGVFFQKQLLQNGMISPEDISLYKITNSVDEAVDELLTFYKVYHSMRYVRDQLVLRLRAPLSDEVLERIRTDFADIVKKGTYEQRGPLPEESGEKELAAYPRLVFNFNRRSLGRLRMLINQINGHAETQTSLMSSR